MKKFNKSKVIIPALAMIALTTAASATGTVAWFTANSTVTATGMSFTAVASTNLFIGASTIQSYDDLTESTINLNTNFAAIKPCTLVNSNGTVTVKNAKTFEQGQEPDYHNPGSVKDYDDIGTITAAPSANTNNPDPLDNYIAHAHVKIARKQNPAAKFSLTPTVTLTFATDSPLNKALRAACIINGNYDETLANTDITESQYTDGKATIKGTKVTNLDDNTLINVALMVWYEGNDADCTTSSAIHLGSCSAEWSFASEDYSQA